MAGQDNKVRNLKVYWNSNAPWSFSGYGVFTGDFVKRMKADGWPLAVGCFYGLDGNPVEIDGTLYYPKLEDTWGTDGMVYNAQDFGANQLESLFKTFESKYGERFKRDKSSS